MLVSLTAQAVGWFVDQFSIIQTGSPMPTFNWLLFTWGQGLALALIVLPLALGTRAPRLRAAYRLWALAIVLLFVLPLPRLVPLLEKTVAALAQAALALAAAAALWFTAARSGRSLGPRGGPLALALAAGAALYAPWVAFGALGSPLNALLNALAGYAFGLLAGVLIGLYLLATPRATTGEVAFSGFVAGVALLITTSAFGFGGSQFLLMAALPPLGFALVALARIGTASGQNRAPWLALAVLAGSATAAPLLFFDPAELQPIILSEEDIPVWAARAALFAFVLALALGLVLRAVQRRLPGPAPLRYLAAAALLALVALYAVEGRPGFYGDKLFVILREQPDVSAAANIADRGERARYVYDTLARRAAESQADLRATLDRLRIPYRPFYLVNALEVDAGPLVRAYLASRPEVDRVLSSPHLRPLPEPPPGATGTIQAAPSSPPWNIGEDGTGAERVWSELGVTGKGIVVGQSDSGVQGDHPALRDGYRGRDGQNDYNWLDPWSHTAAPRDLGGHGTHTLGSVLGDGGIGQAPDAEWFACVNLERNLANPALYLTCLQFMLAPYPQGGDPFTEGDPARAAHVLNNSWGCPPVEGCDPGALQTAVRALRAAGIFVVASAGNEGPSCGTVSDPLALYDEVFTVGALDPTGNVAEFSSRGPVTADDSGRVKPDILAPGVDVLSAYPNSTYQVLEGTSMAGPQVAGVVALMWSANPRLIGDVERTERILIETAKPYSGRRSGGCFVGETPNNAYGYGLVDAYAAVQAALAAR